MRTGGSSGKSGPLRWAGGGRRTHADVDTGTASGHHRALLVEPPSLVAGLVFKTSGAARERRSGGSIPLLYRRCASPRMPAVACELRAAGPCPATPLELARLDAAAAASTGVQIHCTIQNLGAVSERARAHLAQKRERGFSEALPDISRMGQRSSRARIPREGPSRRWWLAEAVAAVHRPQRVCDPGPPTTRRFASRSDHRRRGLLQG